LTVGVAATLSLFVLSILLAPDMLPIFPAAIAVPIWLALFPPNQQVDERTRVVLQIAAIAGVVMLLVFVAVFLLLAL
jgi:hypothetical protein